MNCTLMHKNIEVAELVIAEAAVAITDIVKIHNPEHVPIGVQTLKGEVDMLPRFADRYKIMEQVKRLKAGICELYGKDNIPVIMHHVRKLKDLKGNSEGEELMRNKRRKSLAVCNYCHDLIHEST